jgi:hypothetical protein
MAGIDIRKEQSFECLRALLIRPPRNHETHRGRKVYVLWTLTTYRNCVRKMKCDFTTPKLRK